MLEGYPTFEAKSADGRFFVSHAGQAVTFYTERSAERDLRQLRGLLHGSAEQVPVIVAPYAAALEPVFHEGLRFTWIAPAVFTSSLPADERLITDETAMQAFINSIGPDDRFTVHILPQWQGFSEAVRTATQNVLARAAVRLRTIRHFGRLWTINFRLNQPLFSQFADVKELQLAPDAIVMAGPSLDAALPQLRSAHVIWCADTALPVLARQGIFPQVVFSLDAGFGSREHYVGLAQYLAAQPTSLVADPLSFPGVLRLPFSRIYTYASSHPLMQAYAAQQAKPMTQVENTSGNVGGLMLALKEKLFSDTKPLIVGKDGGHRSYASHARGTAYYFRALASNSRVNTLESYFMSVSRRYGAAPG